MFTVCDNAVGEACPIFLGSAKKEHWGVADPSAIENNSEAAFQEYLQKKIKAFVFEGLR